MVAELMARLFSTSQRFQRNLALSISLALCLAAFMLVWGGVSLLSRTYDELQDARVQLGNLQRLDAAANALNQATLSDGNERVQDFFTGANSDVVGAKLQAWLQETVDELGGQLASSEVVNMSSKNTVSVAADIEGSWKSLQNLLVRIETSRPALFVENLNIVSNDYDDRAGEPSLNMHIVFSGIRNPVADAKEGS
ncbi:type II secretion system protein GspM [Rhizobium alvei]|uniref:Type II secretion system protein GspM n=1 Tax=Rhizobium alvei TaxID=1132659 RepID=A0ABT8YND5_9HYPH|nr:type II secretion system protein GspM [Rhizobium alvei]MDO6965240.1 type II secretion system protein GspM [Rhizobium alvei]